MTTTGFGFVTPHSMVAQCIVMSQELMSVLFAQIVLGVGIQSVAVKMDMKSNPGKFALLDTNSMEENIGKILSGHMSDVSSRNGGDDASSDFGQPGANTSFSDEDTLSDLRVEKRTRLKDKSKGLARFSTARGADDAAVPQRRPSDVVSDLMDRISQLELAMDKC